MKYIKSFLILTAAIGIVACSDDATSVDFGLNTTEIKLGPEGGTKSVRVAADKSWTASTDKSWILISPANGSASTECKIRIDSSLVSHAEEGEVTFAIEGQERKIKITREGFPVQITVPEVSQAIKLPSYADSDNAYFDVEVVSNVDFEIVVPDEAAWVYPKEFKQIAPIGYRPRTTKIRFLWDINSKPMEQLANITFKPVETTTRQDAIKVTQEAAQKIVPSRAGDSIAVLAIARNLHTWGTAFDPSKSMIYWDDLTLWEAKDAQVKKDPSLLGRVRFVEFYLSDTKMSLPYEIQYLTAVDSLVIFSNSNRHIRNIKLGSEICKLTQLRSLRLESYGVCELPADFTALKNLESLELGSNNFMKFPDIITKENFPKLRNLGFNYSRVEEVYDLSNNIKKDLGIGGTIPQRLLEWDNLESLTLSFCYFEGSLPTMDASPKYTAEDEAVQKGWTEVGVPKVLPKMKALKISNNRLTGNLPEWILKHPNLYYWEPYIFIFQQEGKDSRGVLAKFDNVPEKVNPPKK
ncbi:MAG: hypothetical protein RR199_05700 [Alistipes sp.]